MQRSQKFILNSTNYISCLGQWCDYAALAKIYFKFNKLYFLFPFGSRHQKQRSRVISVFGYRSFLRCVCVVTRAVNFPECRAAASAARGVRKAQHIDGGRDEEYG